MASNNNNNSLSPKPFNQIVPYDFNNKAIILVNEPTLSATIQSQTTNSVFFVNTRFVIPEHMRTAHAENEKKRKRQPRRIEELFMEEAKKSKGSM